jgi:hypothetical protein
VLKASKLDYTKLKRLTDIPALGSTTEKKTGQFYLFLDQVTDP